MLQYPVDPFELVGPHGRGRRDKCAVTFGTSDDADCNVEEIFPDLQRLIDKMKDKA